MEKFKGKYRISSARLQNWDYGWNALYFITICTQNRELFFGEIINHKMQLSEIGELSKKYWFEIPEKFSFIKLDEFVVMPNHIHGIIEIAKTDNKQNDQRNDKSYRNIKNYIINNPEKWTGHTFNSTNTDT